MKALQPDPACPMLAHHVPCCDLRLSAIAHQPVLMTFPLECAEPAGVRVNALRFHRG